MTFKNTLEENRGRIQRIYRNINVISFVMEIMEHVTLCKFRNDMRRNFDSVRASTTHSLMA